MIHKRFSIFKYLISIVISLPFLYGGDNTLKDYVNRSDTTFSYNERHTYSKDNYTVHVLEVFSQTWKSADVVDRAHWQHWVNIIVPDTLKYEKALVLISGGSNGDSPPSSVDDEIVSLALMSNSVVIEVKMIPNEPVVFSDETFKRSEDAIIAYTWDKYLRTGDADWPLQLPMVKGVVKSMDAVQDFFRSVLNDGNAVNEFVLLGASKRGWTTWLTGAIDDRVVAIIPVVFDALNLVDSFNHHYGAYGFWSPAVGDYEAAGIFDWFPRPEIYDLMKIVDPLNYKDDLMMPKFLIHSAGDEFFVPSSQYYFDKLDGPKYQRYVANTGHGMDDKLADVIISAVAFYRAILNDYTLPEFSWEVVEDGSIRFETVTEPKSVRVWTATNEDEFDFRYYTMGPIWKDSLLTESESGVYIANISEPLSGYSAFFIEASYNSVYPYYYTFSTDVSFLPKQLPHAATISFQVMGVSGNEGVFSIQGDMTSQMIRELFDDGQHDDQEAGDGLWALTLKNVIDGEYKYNVILHENDTMVKQNDVPLSFLVQNGHVSGTTSYLIGSVGTINEGVVENFNLSPAYPNPFNPRTTFKYSVKTQNHVSVNIYDINGNWINTIVNKMQHPGHYEAQWDGSGLSSGIYFITMVSGDFIQSQKALLLK